MHRSTFSAIVGASLLATSAVAQDALVTQQGADELRGDWVIGASVTSMEDETIGDIEDIIINEADGTIVAAVVSVGGFLGFGAKSIAVDWSELNINWDADEITIALTREEAEEAPEYEFRERELEPLPVDPNGGGVGDDAAPAMD
jgi:sporulation protein YlmC with PRC-barrel domain